MKIIPSEAIIELTSKEGGVFLGALPATPDMLAEEGHPSGGYRTFRERVEHRAAELHHETGRTVEVHVETLEDRLAVADDDGLRLEKREAIFILCCLKKEKKPSPRMLEHLRLMKEQGKLSVFYNSKGFGMGTADKYQGHGWVERAGDWAAKGSGDVGCYRLTPLGQTILEVYG